MLFLFFCEQCLKQYVESGKTKCAVCTTPFQLTSSQIDSLPINFAIEQQIISFQLQQQTTNDSSLPPLPIPVQICTGCEEETDVAAVVCRVCGTTVGVGEDTSC